MTKEKKDMLLEIVIWTVLVFVFGFLMGYAMNRIN